MYSERSKIGWWVQYCCTVDISTIVRNICMRYIYIFGMYNVHYTVHSGRCTVYSERSKI